MNITCQREEFQRGVATVQNAVGAKISSSIVENILLDANEHGLAFLATNLQLSLRYQGEADVAVPGKIAVSARMLSSLASELLGDEVRLELAESVLNLQCGRSRFRLYGMSADDFPPFLPVVEGCEFELPVDVLKQMIQRTVFAVSEEKMRFELDAVKLDCAGGTLCMVATDGKRLCYSTFHLDGFEDSISALLPSRTAREVLRVLSSEGSAKVTLSDGKVMIVKDNVTMVSTLLQGNFPPYMSIIPASSAHKMTVEREALLHGVRSVLAIPKERSSMIRFVIGKEELKLRAEEAQVGEAEVALPIEYEGEPMTVGYQGHYILEVLRVLTSEKVSLNLNDNRLPGVIRPVGDDSFLYVIMPMRLPEDEETTRSDYVETNTAEEEVEVEYEEET